MRSTIRNVAATTATVLVFALTATVLVFASMAPPAAQARVIDCVVQPQPPQGACYEPVWVNGQQIIMTFPQDGVPVHKVPSAKQQPFYVLAPQTGTAQGQTPGFFHDHVIATAPSRGWLHAVHARLLRDLQPARHLNGCLHLQRGDPSWGCTASAREVGHRL